MYGTMKQGVQLQEDLVLGGYNVLGGICKDQGSWEIAKTHIIIFFLLRFRTSGSNIVFA